MKYISLHSNEIQEKWIPLWPFRLKCVQCIVDFYKPISLWSDINISGFSEKYKIHMLHLKISIAVYKKSRVSKNSISNIVNTFMFKILFYYRIVIISKYEKSYEYTTNDCENYHIRTKNVISYTCVCMEKTSGIMTTLFAHPNYPHSTSEARHDRRCHRTLTRRQCLQTWISGWRGYCKQREAGYSVVFCTLKQNGFVQSARNVSHNH